MSFQKDRDTERLNFMKMYVPIESSGLLLTLILAAFLPVGAAETNGYDGPRWALLDARKAVAAAGEITPAKYPDSDEATVEKKMVRVYRADGTGECQDESFVKVLTEKGKRNNRSLSLYYMLPYSTAQAIKLEVMKPDGQ